jgi:predicted dehydrogenase
VTCLADPDPERLRAASDRYGVATTFPSHRELLASGLVDGVVIAVPHAFHYEIARDALDSGIHVMVEKPMVLRASEAWDLVERAKAGGLHLVVGYTYHFTRHAARAREVISSGELGELLFVSGLFASMVESYYRGRPGDYLGVFDFPLTGPHEKTYSDPALSGGGQGQTQITHAMGMVFWLTGARAVEVSAYMESRDLAVDLVDAISYRLDNGAIGTMGSTGSLRPGQPQQQELRYYGTEGFLLQELIHGKLSVHRNDGTSESPPDLEEDELYLAHATARCLVDLILGDGDNRAPAEPAAAVVEFLEAAYRSASDRRPVRVDELQASPPDH